MSPHQFEHQRIKPLHEQTRGILIPPSHPLEAGRHIECVLLDRGLTAILKTPWGVDGYVYQLVIALCCRETGIEQATVPSPGDNGFKRTIAKAASAIKLNFGPQGLSLTVRPALELRTHCMDPRETGVLR